MTTFSQYRHYPNTTELGKGNTHETYLLVGREFDLSSMFVPGLDILVKNECGSEEYYLKAAQGNEFRINQMGQLYRDFDIIEGDEIVLTKIDDGILPKYYFRVEKHSQVLLSVGGNGTEVGGIERLSAFGSKETGYTFSLHNEDGDVPFSLTFDGQKKKRADSPDLTDFYVGLLNGEPIQNGKYHFDFENNVLLTYKKASYNTVSINDEIIDDSNPHPCSSSDIEQTIYFGAPGTGKSYKIENEILNGVPDTSKIRVTFYPDYYYSDFIGGLRPKKQGEDITYEFTAGPFAEALLKSFTEPTYLIIEEINRGNPAAIFGDIFQLLDRRDDGRSRYETTNEELYNYLVRENPDLTSELPEKKVFLPASLHILCTMNTADQNVFVLDTAFKRRFSMEYIPIDMDVFSRDPKLAPYKDESYPAFKGSEDLATLLGETGSSIAEPKRNWPTFATFVNAKIDEINSSETKISEDKKLGPFFADVADFNDRKKFADKVLFYLKQDVFRYEDTILTDSYEKIYYDFVKGNKDAFSIFE